GKIDFDVKYLVMNPGFNEENLIRLKENAEKMGIPIIIKESNVFHVSELLGKDQPCYLCAKMRRGFLYDFAIEQGCNKIALGHHFNDVIETTLLNILYAGTFKTMVPKLKSTNHPGMELIRPMVYIEEKDIINYIDYCEIKAMNCGCRIARSELPSKRREVKEMIKNLKKDFKDVEKCIYSSAENVNLNCVMKWHFKDKDYNFLDYYDEEEI
ncbi:MAG: ATP-binding protein, partial [Bacilli bacterium]|nr:ATP-binding protein [Bacilli bacterium]